MTLAPAGADKLEARGSFKARGDFVAWTVCAAAWGRAVGTIAPHSHYAIQLAIGAPAGLRVKFGPYGEWQPSAAALVQPRATHTTRP